MSDVAVLDSPRIVPDVESFRSLSGAARDEAFMTVEREIRRLQALQAELIAAVDSSGSFVDDFHRTAMNWCQGVLNASRGTAVMLVQTARMLADLPAVAHASGQGLVGADQLRLLTRLHANPRSRDQLPAWEEFLVEQACQLTFGDFVVVCQRWLAGADPDGAHRDQEAAKANRSVASTRLGAGHLLRVEGDAVTGEILTEILDAHTEAEYHQDVADRAAKHGAQADQFPLARTGRQRRYDALVAIFLKAAATTATTTRVPLVNLVCTPEQLVKALRTLVDRDPLPTEAGQLPLSETTGGAPVDPIDLALAALTGHIRRVLVDSAGRVLDLGRRSRLFTGAAREAVLLTGKACTHPGCGQHHGLQIDHLNPWLTHLGATNPLNGGPECGHHNRAKHRGRITVSRDHTGWHHYRPDGTEICPRGL
jgi:Domain of unknown function (DUF222)